MCYEAGSKECRHLIEAKESLLSAMESLSNISQTDVIQIQIKDIYQFIKSIDTDTFEQFLRVRKLMLNWIKVDQQNENLKKFSKISEKCDKVHFKLTAIFTNKLFPNIMPDDIPDISN